MQVSKTSFPPIFLLFVTVLLSFHPFSVNGETLRKREVQVEPECCIEVPPACELPKWMIGDGNCDREANNESCDFDRGDCSARNRILCFFLNKNCENMMMGP